MEVKHLRLVCIETDPYLGSPYGQICEQTFNLTLRFDNDGDIVYIDKGISIFQDQLFEQQFIHDGEQQRRTRASLFDSSGWLIVDAVPLDVTICVAVPVHLVDSCHVVIRVAGMR